MDNKFKKSMHDKFDNMICPKCKYQNKKVFVCLYGTCKLCGKVLDDKAKFKHDMYAKMNLWRSK